MSEQHQSSATGAASDEQIVIALEHPGIRNLIEDAELSARVIAFDGLDQVEQYAGAKVVDLVLLPEEAGIDSAGAVQAAQRLHNPQGQVLLIDALGRAVGLVNLDPWRGPDAPPPPGEDDLQEILAALLEYSRVGRLTGLLGESDAVASVLRTITRVAPTDVPVLIRGPSGTGKELIAQGIHKASLRYGNPFIAVNTPGLSETLIESELFGHEKGAFTGAINRKAGVFEAAGEGTIFLDEIGDLSRGLQSKLLRVLEQHEFQRVGGTEPIRVKARVLAATNVDLERAVHEGRFREDLYYRLQVVTVDMPPLRERPEDIVPLLQHFVAQVCKAHNMTFVGFTEDAIGYLRRYPWPGNVRELRNLVEQVVLLHTGEKITAGRMARILEERSRDTRNLPAPTGKTPDQVERELIFQSLQALREEVSDLRASVEILGATAVGRNTEVLYPGGELFRRSAEEEEGIDESLRGSIQVPLGIHLEDVELRLIEATLRRLGGDKRKTAEVLGIGLRTLYRRLERLDEKRRESPVEQTGEEES